MLLPQKRESLQRTTFRVAVVAVAAACALTGPVQVAARPQVAYVQRAVRETDLLPEVYPSAACLTAPTHTLQNAACPVSS